LIIDKVVIADTKVVTSFCDADLAQVLGYLNITALRLAILLNFKKAKLEWKRIVLSFCPRISLTARMRKSPSVCISEIGG
jgi:hypothetical protein